MTCGAFCAVPGCGGRCSRFGNHVTADLPGKWSHFHDKVDNNIGEEGITWQEIVEHRWHAHPLEIPA